MDEEWGQLEEFPDYAISNYGRVLNLKRDTLLTPYVNSYGHERVALYRSGVRYDVYIHHLVGKTFTTGYMDGGHVKHRDGDKSNHRPENLRYTTRGIGQRIRHPNNVTVRRVKIVETGAIFKNVTECALHLGCDPSIVYRILRGERMTHRGYTFEYTEEVL